MDDFPFVYDPYSNRNRLLGRLRKEYAAHGRLIIAVDFDDTIFDTHHHGWRYDGVVDTLKRWDGHATFILWTASLPDRYPQLREVWTGYGLPDDIIINEKCAGNPFAWPKNLRKHLH